MALTLRTLKGSRLTHQELDDNFRHFTASHAVDGTVTATAFVGDGSGLTGITAEWDGSHDGNGEITGSFVVSGSGAKVDFRDAEAGVSGSFSGSFEGDGSGLTGIAADLTGTTVISGSTQIADLGAGIVSGSVQLDGEVFGFSADIVASGSFSGSFEGDGSNLTGVVKGAGMSYDANTEHWNISKAINLNNSIYVAPVGVTLNGMHTQFGNGNFYNPIRFNASELRFFDQGSDDWFQDATMFIKGGLGHISASAFSGSFYGDGSGLTGVTATANLTGTGILSGSAQIAGLGAEIISGSDLTYNTILERWTSERFFNFKDATFITNDPVGGVNTGDWLFAVAADPYIGTAGVFEFQIARPGSSVGASINNAAQAVFRNGFVNLEDGELRLVKTSTDTSTIKLNSTSGRIDAQKLVLPAPAGGQGYVGSLEVSNGGGYEVVFQGDANTNIVHNGTKSLYIGNTANGTLLHLTASRAEVNGSVTASAGFYGDGSGLTNLPAQSPLLPLVNSLPTPGAVGAVTGAMVLFDDPNQPGLGTALEAWVYTGETGNAGHAGWKQISLV